MVEDEGESGQQFGGLRGGGQLVLQDDQVVHESGGGDGGQTAAYVRAQQPLRVRLPLHLMAYPHQPVAAGQFAQRGEGVRDPGRGEIGPADDARDEVAPVRGGKELGGLLGDPDGLDEHGRGHPGGPGLGVQVREGEVPAEGSHGRAGDPVLVAYGQIPDVVVGVDHARRCHDSSQTTGSPAPAPAAE